MTFLAILELARERLLDLAQAEPFAPIYVQRKGDPAFALEGERSLIPCGCRMPRRRRMPVAEGFDPACADRPRR